MPHQHRERKPRPRSDYHPLTTVTVSIVPYTMKRLRTYFRAALAILLGERCVVCGEFLPGGKVCDRCYLEFPFLNIKGVSGNPIERCFWGVVPIERANALVSYRPGAKFGEVLHAIKYHGRKDLAIEMGRIMASELLGTGFFDNIDAIQPVPLHPRRMRERGYNQSECLAEGISEITGIKIADYIKRTQYNVSQTTLNHEERKKNVEGIFLADKERLDQEQPKHILFVDDVITTGATIINCIQALTTLQPKGLRVSVMSLAYAGRLHVGRVFPEDMENSCYASNAEFREKQILPLS